MKNKKVYIPILLAVAMVLGIGIGYLLSVKSTISMLERASNNIAIKSGKNHKANELLNIVEQAYVDTIDMDKMNEAVIATALSQLDPHSTYISKEDLAAANEQLDGSFSGIGVQFNINEDTIYVVDVVSNGPAEKGGMLPGDRIIEVDDSAFVGKSINNEKVFRRLRGSKGSEIKVGVARRGTAEKLVFDIVRDDIPVNSVDIAYMITPTIGMISINSFGANTYKEFIEGLSKLRYLGAEKLIIDLRGNGGGYLEAAVNMVNEFLSKGDPIVYIEGQAFPRSETKANGSGSLQHIPLVVLIDEFSASASEIFAGAIQDNDRGTIIGRRSFGKGLVQQPFPFSDGSEARITIARYYTPSGRCIQKPYERGKSSDYATDIWNRYMHGEFFSADSIHLGDSIEYRTAAGRIVYGGGGIMPDVFVPRDTSHISLYFTRLVNKALIYKFALGYTEKHRAEMNQFDSWTKLDHWLQEQNVVEEMIVWAEKQHGITRNNKDIVTSRQLLTQHLHSYIIRNIQGDEGFYPYVFRDDPEVVRAMKELKEGV